MKPLYTTWLRRVALVLATLFFGTLFMAPQWNPLLRGSLVTTPQTAAQLFNGWNEIHTAKMLLNVYVSDTGEWPQDLAVSGIRTEGQVFALSSTTPYELVATVQAQAPLSSNLRGQRVVLRLDADRLQWDCAPGDPPIPSRYLPMTCRIDGDNSTDMTRWLSVVLAAAVLILLACAMLLLWRHPLIAPLQRDPARLRRTPLAQLPRIDRVLGWLRRRDDTLAAARVEPGDWRDALAFAALPAAAQADMLALRVAARSVPSDGWTLPGTVYEWTFSAEMPVSLERCLLWLPAAQLDPAALLRHLRQAQTGLDVLLVLSPATPGEGALRSFCANRDNLFVCLDQELQTAWLLEHEALPVLLRALARQLRITRISPYQTRGGVARASSFFGRESLLARVVQREPANYLLIGGRQLGKTSLMKAIERRLRDHPQLACLYLVLRDHRLLPRLAALAGLPLDSSLEPSIAELVRQQGGKRLLLLIDEADPFFRADAEQGYAQLSSLRALSEEGRCHFLLAGFWDLYAAAALDYQSPLRNFGEAVSVGGLEENACRELATVPLQVLNLRFETPQLVERIVSQSGRRANLVAILCQECLEALPAGATTISAQEVEQALHSTAVLDALAGWGRLSADVQASRLDRIVVYRVAANGSTSLADVIQLLRTHADVEVEAIRACFARLQLAYVLRKQDSRLVFAVPLFLRQFETAEIPLLLAEELRALG